MGSHHEFLHLTRSLYWKLSYSKVAFINWQRKVLNNKIHPLYAFWDTGYGVFNVTVAILENIFNFTTYWNYLKYQTSIFHLTYNGRIRFLNPPNVEIATKLFICVVYLLRNNDWFRISAMLDAISKVSVLGYNKGFFNEFIGESTISYLSCI